VNVGRKTRLQHTKLDDVIWHIGETESQLGHLISDSVEYNLNKQAIVERLTGIRNDLRKTLKKFKVEEL